MAYPLAALQLRPSPFDPVGTLQVAANLGQAQANSELAQLRMAELREESAENRELRGALRAFRADDGINNPAAANRHLSGHPAVLAQVQGVMTAQQTITREANARAAQRVASIPEGPERAAAWQEELENARREGRMTPEQYQRYAAIPMPPSTFLQGIIQQGRALPTTAELQREREMERYFGPRTPPAAGPPATPPGAARVTVNADNAGQFQGLFRDLEASGVRVDPAQTGGYNPRNIAGTNTPSLHASGRAVDVNWRDNPEGALALPPRGNEPFNPNNLVDAAGDRTGQTEIPSELARALARKNDLRWGGDFRTRSPDPMHFEVAGAPPVAGRALTTIAGAQPAAAPVVPAAATAPPAARPAQAPAGPQADMSLEERIDSLTREQRSQVALLWADGKKEDALKLMREFSNAGTMNPRQRAETEEGLRREIATLFKPYNDVRDAYTRIETAARAPSAAGDLALIFNFMKMLDPGSTVREGEFATAQNAAGVPDRIRAMYERVLSGTRLTDDQRADFVGQSQGLMRGQERQYLAMQRQFEGIASRMGLEPRNVMIDYTRPGPDGYEASSLLAEARAAIAGGKDPAAVRKRLGEMGIDPSQLDVSNEQPPGSPDPRMRGPR